MPTQAQIDELVRATRGASDFAPILYHVLDYSDLRTTHDTAICRRPAELQASLEYYRELGWTIDCYVLSGTPARPMVKIQMHRTLPAVIKFGRDRGAARRFVRANFERLAPARQAWFASAGLAS